VARRRPRRGGLASSCWLAAAAARRLSSPPVDSVLVLLPGASAAVRTCDMHAIIAPRGIVTLTHSSSMAAATIRNTLYNRLCTYCCATQRWVVGGRVRAPARRITEPDIASSERTRRCAQCALRTGTDDERATNSNRPHRRSAALKFMTHDRMYHAAPHSIYIVYIRHTCATRDGACPQAKAASEQAA
jgi:hypothetical protein